MKSQPMSVLTEPEYSQEQIEIVSKKRSFDGFFAVDTMTLRHKRYRCVVI